MTPAEHMPPGRVMRLLRISLPVVDLDRTELFYRNGLDFEPVASTTYDDPAFGRLLGLDGVHARSLRMRIGLQDVEFVAYHPTGEAYPRRAPARICGSSISQLSSATSPALMRE